MSRPVVLGAFAVLSALALGWFVVRGPSRSTSALAPRPTETESAAPAATGDDSAATTSASRGERSLVTTVESAETTAEGTRSATTSWLARGVVLDPLGRPVAGLSVLALPRGAQRQGHEEWREAAARARDRAPAGHGARSDADGRFRLPTELDAVEVFVDDGQWTTLHCGFAARYAGGEESLVVVVPAQRVAGHVVDEAGALVAGATFEVNDERGRDLPGFPRPLQRCLPVAWRWTSDGTGAFDLAGYGTLPRRRVDVSAPGHPRVSFYPGDADRLDWLVTLPRTPEPPPGGFELRSEPLLYGYVREAGGEPVPNALVVLVDAETRTDRDGRFELERPGWVPTGVALVARAPDGRLAVERDEDAWSGSGTRIGPLDLRLGPPLREVTGRVVDATGAPLPGWRVGLLDATVVDSQRRPASSVERGLGRGARWPVSGADGRFTLTVLAGRAYRVVALDAATLLSLEATLAADQRELELVLRADAFVPELRGRVLDQDGWPVRGIDVALSSFADRYALEEGSRLSPCALTDADGRFVFTKVPREGLSLMVFGAAVATRGFAPSGAELDAGDVELRVQRDVLVQLDGHDASEVPTTAWFEDSEGRRRELRLPGTERSERTEVELLGGLSGVVAVTPEARTVVFARNGAVTARVTLQSGRDEVTVVRAP